MRDGRGADITATLLPDGRVLVASGWRVNHKPAQLQSAEIFDPGSGRWSSTVDMTETIHEATATLLLDGTVLVIGWVFGSDGEVRGSSEIFDPATGIWSLTEGRPPRARRGHRAVRLPDGRVLLVGGIAAVLEAGNPLAPEIYDPSTGHWSLVQEMSRGRMRPAAILLTDGRVLVAGGQGSGSSSAEIYDPITDEWSEAASKSTGVVSPTFTRLQDGRVLVVGGLRKIGLTSAEIYDPISDTWSVTESMSQPTRRSRWSVVLNDGRVLAGGGGSLVS